MGMGSDNNFPTFGETQAVSLSGLGMPKNRGVSEKTAEAVDGEINKLIRMAYGKARGILNGNSDKLSNLAKELIEKETLSAEEIDSAISGQ